MKKYCTILFLLISSFTFAQTSSFQDAAKKLDKALLTKDTVALKQLLHQNLTYGHSNGWVETKTDLLQNLISGKLVYHKVESKEVKWSVTGDAATLRSATDIQYTLDGKPGELKLHVLQVWLKINKGWQLLARQSAKL